MASLGDQRPSSGNTGDHFAVLYLANNSSVELSPPGVVRSPWAERSVVPATSQHTASASVRIICLKRTDTSFAKYFRLGSAETLPKSLASMGPGNTRLPVSPLCNPCPARKLRAS